jgi:hypothetical protein
LDRVRCPVRKKFFKDDPDVYQLLLSLSFKKCRGYRISQNVRASAHTIYLFFDALFKLDRGPMRVARFLTPKFKDIIRMRLAELGEIESFYKRPTDYVKKIMNKEVI